MEFLKKNAKMLGIIAALVVGGFTLWGIANGIQQEAVRREVQLSTQYQSNQNTLSTFILTYRESLGIADRKAEQLDRILVDAVKGRYGEGGFGQNGSLMNAISEAYPTTNGLDVYDKIIDIIQAGRAEYKDDQNKLLDMLRSYDTWRKSGIFKRMVLGDLYPSGDLVARIGTTRFTGPEALEKMYQIVLVSDAKRAYETGEMEALAPPPLPKRD